MGFRNVLVAASVMATLGLASAQPTVPVVVGEAPVVAQVPVEPVVVPPPVEAAVAPVVEEVEEAVAPAPEEGLFEDEAPAPGAPCEPIGDVLDAQFDVNTLTDVVGLVASSPEVQGLIGAATATETLPAEQQYTVFAPNDSAFAQLKEMLEMSNPELAAAIPAFMSEAEGPAGEAPMMAPAPPQPLAPEVQQVFAQVLGTHIVQGAYTIQDVVAAVAASPNNQFTVQTITGQTLVLSEAITYTYEEESTDPTDIAGIQRGVITVSVLGAESEAKALILKPNQRSCAGIVHVIDEVLQPGAPQPQPLPQPQPEPVPVPVPAARKLLGVFA